MGLDELGGIAAVGQRHRLADTAHAQAPAIVAAPVLQIDQKGAGKLQQAVPRYRYPQ